MEDLMPPLKQMLRPGGETLQGFAAAENPPKSPPSVPNTVTSGANPYIRCPIPPLNIDPDTLRQFNQNGKTPTRRVIPLPISTVGGGGSVTNTTVINEGSSSSGSSTTKLVSASVALSVPSLTPGQVFVATVTMAKSFQLLQITSTQAVEVRVYSNSSAQSSDRVRITDAPVPFEVFPGIITDIVFDTAPYIWNWQNRIGANASSPQTTSIYVTVINPSQLTGVPAATISIQYLPLES
jgi:hypothetical protein